MPISNSLLDRCQGNCELCNENKAEIEFLVSPKSDENYENFVAICNTCNSAMQNKESSFHWRCLEGSVWNPNPSVLALSYRLIYEHKEEEWANQILSSLDIDEEIRDWAMFAFEETLVHKDAFGNILQNGDNVVLTQPLDVKGTSFTASKGTVVKRIKLVHDNPEQIEGRINDQTIVILTKFTKKG